MPGSDERLNRFRDNGCVLFLLLLWSASVWATTVAPHRIDGLGSLSFPTSTRSESAQAAFEQGMLLLHLFEYPRAEQAFQAAERIDPAFAMAYWGEAMTATHPVWNQQNIEQGRAVSEIQ